jgi:uncharacterized protein YbaR (Trm112 family)
MFYGFNMVECDACGEFFHEEDIKVLLHEIENLGTRLTPDCPVPFGECPRCGGFVYIVSQKREEEDQLRIGTHLWRPGTCPVCNSTLVEGKGVEIEGGSATQEVVCLDCGSSWRAEFSVSRIQIHSIRGKDV